MNEEIKLSERKQKFELKLLSTTETTCQNKHRRKFFKSSLITTFPEQKELLANISRIEIEAKSSI